MSHPRFLPILLAVALVAQSVIAGWGHSHAPLADGSHSHATFDGHSHHHHAAGDHDHTHDSHEHPSLPHWPTDKDDCAVCRHLALAAIVTLDLVAVSTGDTAEPVQDRESSLITTIAVGLRQPRAPPELS